MGKFVGAEPAGGAITEGADTIDGSLPELQWHGLTCCACTDQQWIPRWRI